MTFLLLSARDGKNLSMLDLIAGLKAGYNLSTPLAVFLTVGGFVLLRRIRNVSLHEIGEHGRIEHNASLVHGDTPNGEKYAPVRIHQELVGQLIADVTPSDGGGDTTGAGEDDRVMDASDVARSRVRREKQSPRLDPVHAEIARGEMAIILGVWDTKSGNKSGIPVQWMRDWIGQERLPSGWVPTHVQSLLDVVRRSKSIRQSMIDQRRAAAAQVDEKAKL